jgi:hypothetical protein
MYLRLISETVNVEVCKAMVISEVSFGEQLGFSHQWNQYGLSESENWTQTLLFEFKRGEVN